jgi:O-antigen ligase
MEYLLGRIRTIRSEIHHINDIKELLDYIKLPIEKLSLILLGLWILTPVIILILAPGIPNEQNYKYYVGDILGIEWNVYLQQIGFVGFFILITLTCNYFNNIERKVLEKNYTVIILCLLVLMLIWSTISTVLSDDKTLSFYGTFYRKDGLLSYLSYAGIFSCGYAVRKNENILRLLELHTWVASILSLLILIDNGNINKIFSLNSNSAIFYNINHFGYYSCIAIMCSVTLILSGDKGSFVRRLLRFLLFIVLTAALVKNSSFGPYLAVMAGLTLLVFFKEYMDENQKKKLLLIILFFIIVTLSINVMRSSMFAEIKKLLFGIDKIIKKDEDAGTAGSGRWILWVNGIRFIFEKPIFGYGPDNLGARYLLEGINIDRPHNEIIQFAASLGIPAALFYVSAILLHFRNLYKYKEHVSILCLGLYSAVFTYFVSSMFGNTMFYTSPFYFMIFGLSVGNMNNTLIEKGLLETNSV